MSSLKKYYFGKSKNITISKSTWVATIASPSGSNRKAGIYMNPTGTRLFSVADTNELAQYDLTVPYSIASITTNFLSTSETGNHTGIALSADGTKFFYTTFTTNQVKSFNLTTAWDVSSKTSAGNFTIPANSSGVHFKDDGTMMFISTSTTRFIYKYILSTPWDVTSASLHSSLDLTSLVPTSITDLKIDKAGRFLFMLTNIPSEVKQLKLPSSFDISSYINYSTYNDVASVGACLGLYIDETKLKMYVSRNTGSASFSELNLKR